MDLLKNILLVIIGYASGTVIAGGVFAFIAVIGIVPRLAQKTETIGSIKFYEDIIVLGGIFGCLDMYINYKLYIGSFLVAIIALSIGVFFGCLAVSLAEVLNVMPVFMRRARLTKGLSLLIVATCLGKMFGSLIYFMLPNFY